MIQGHKIPNFKLVKNTVQDIQVITFPSYRHCCSGAYNPADLVSSGAKISKLLNEPNWLLGPKMLSLPSDFLPKGNGEEIDINDLEYNKKKRKGSERIHNQ